MNNEKLSVIRCENVDKSFVQGDVIVNVLVGITARFTQGETYAIRGVSGSGKSTLVQLLAGLDFPTSGNLFFDDRSITNASDREMYQLRNKKIGVVFQEPYLIREFSVLENVCMPGMIQGQLLDPLYRRGRELLHHVGLDGYGDKKPRVLSGGQQQRVALARALCNEPAFLIADEPTGSLDEETGKTVMNLIQECHKTWNMGVIISTHDQYVARYMSHHYYLHHGQFSEVTGVE